MRYRIPDLPTFPSLISLNGFCGRTASCFLPLFFSFLEFIIVGCASVPLSDSVKNLGVTLDCHLTKKTHVSNLVRSANFELRRISSFRHLLSTDATKTLVSAFVL